jgi:hypothetical protein
MEELGNYKRTNKLNSIDRSLQIFNIDFEIFDNLSQEEKEKKLKKRYRLLSLIYHPDKKHEDTEYFQKINSAYSCIANFYNLNISKTGNIKLDCPPHLLEYTEKEKENPNIVKNKYETKPEQQPYYFGFNFFNFKQKTQKEEQEEEQKERKEKEKQKREKEKQNREEKKEYCGKAINKKTKECIKKLMSKGYTVIRKNKILKLKLKKKKNTIIITNDKDLYTLNYFISKQMIYCNKNDSDAEYIITNNLHKKEKSEKNKKLKNELFYNNFNAVYEFVENFLKVKDNTFIFSLNELLCKELFIIFLNCFYPELLQKDIDIQLHSLYLILQNEGYLL